MSKSAEPAALANRGVSKRLSGGQVSRDPMYRTNLRAIKSVRFGEIGSTRVTMKQLVGKEDGAEKTALHEIKILKGGRTNVHSHNWQHQMFVTSGGGLLLTAGKPVPMHEGDVFLIPRGEAHGFEQRGRAPLVILTVTPL